jgi:hypothetical protein
MSEVRFDTYRSEEPGPRQWVAILQVLEPNKEGKLVPGVCMNFWGPTEHDSMAVGLGWWTGEVEKARAREKAILDKQKRLAEYRQGKQA